jgi:undecaprenyl phosphate N,N'-diacetylbacillosamine 1-phosphate transferase
MANTIKQLLLIFGYTANSKTGTDNRKMNKNSLAKKIQLVIKRSIDVIAAIIALLLSSPVFLCIAIAIKLTSRGPVFFRQDRLGKDASIFKLYKFRTMIVGAINIGKGLSVTEKDPRITSVGTFLRKTSLDEIPQLINVLKGDISFVGPRPTVPQHLEYYGEFEKKRLEVKPGITGLAMVKGRASIPWSKRIEYDVEYVDNFSLWLDLKILLQTIWVVIRRKNVYYDYEKNGPPFDLKKPEVKTINKS